MPWHGLCIGGQIALPNGQQRAYPQPPDGDVYIVQAPGQVAPIRTPEETAADSAAGRTWLPYALLSGSSKLYAGQTIGVSAWIYVAPDKSRWLIAAAFGGSNPHTATLTIKRFGEFGRPPEIYTLPVGPANAGISGTPVLFDISLTGDRAVFGIGSREQAKALLLVTISGSGSGLAATLTTWRTYAQCRPAPVHVHNEFQLQWTTILPDVVTTTGCQSGSETWNVDQTAHPQAAEGFEHNDEVTIIIGAVFDASDQLLPVTCHLQAHLQTDLPTIGLGGSGSTTRTWSESTCIGSVLAHTGSIAWSGEDIGWHAPQFAEAKLTIGSVQTTCRFDALVEQRTTYNIVRVPHQPISELSPVHDYSANDVITTTTNTGVIKVDGVTISEDIGQQMTPSEDLTYIDPDYSHPYGGFEGYTLRPYNSVTISPMTMTPVRLTNKLYAVRLTCILAGQPLERRAIARKISPYGLHGSSADDLGLMTAPGIPSFSLQPQTQQFDYRLNTISCWV